MKDQESWYQELTAAQTPAIKQLSSKVEESKQQNQNALEQLEKEVMSTEVDKGGGGSTGKAVQENLISY